jgi:hypothetical protein
MVLAPRLCLFPYPSPHPGRIPTHPSRRSRELRATSSRLLGRRYVPLAATLGFRVDLGLMGIVDSAGSLSVASTAPLAHGEPAVRIPAAEKPLRTLQHTPRGHFCKHISIVYFLPNVSLRLTPFFAQTPHLSLSGIPKYLRFFIRSLDSTLHRQFAYYIISTHRSLLAQYNFLCSLLLYLHILHYYYHHYLSYIWD